MSTPALKLEFSHLRSALPLIIILGLAALLRLYHIGWNSLWIDELASLQLSNGREAGQIDPPLDMIQPRGVDMSGLDDARSWAAIHRALTTDTHPPLYFALLRIWRELFGSSDAAARSLSVICSLLGIAILFDSVRLLHGKTAAIWATAIMGLATPQIVFAQEARGYAMVTLFLLCAVSAISRIQMLGYSRSRLIGLAASVLVATLTHYIAIPAAIGLGLYVILQLRGSILRSVLMSLFTAVAIFLIFWGPVLWQQRPYFITNLQWNADDQPASFGNTLKRLATLPIQFLITPRSADTDTPIAWLGVVFYLSPLLALRRREMLIWILPAAGIIGSTAISDLLQHRNGLEVLRFTVAAAPCAYALIAAAGASLPREWVKQVLPAAVVLGCILALPEAYNRYWKPDYRGMAAEFDRAASPNDLLIVPYRSRQEDWEKSLLITAVTHYSRYPHRPILVVSKPLSDELDLAIAKAPGAWLCNIGKDQTFASHLPGTQMIGAPHIGLLMKIATSQPAGQ